jgi:ATP-dependent Clp protease, protease subunit
VKRAAKRGACSFVFVPCERLIADTGWQVPGHLREAWFERGVLLQPDLPGAIPMEVNEEKPEAPERVETLADRLAFKSRFVMLFGEINHAVARATCTRLIALAEDSDAPITVLISSPGGHVESGDSIHDIIRFVRAPVTTVGTGWVASAGTHVFLAAPRERRLCLPNTRFMIHQPGGGAGGPATDIAIQAKEILRTRERIAKVISKQTGQSLQKVLTDMERDFWMSAEEAIAYGLVSKIIETSRELG